MTKLLTVPISTPHHNASLLLTSESKKKFKRSYSSQNEKKRRQIPNKHCLTFEDTPEQVKIVVEAAKVTMKCYDIYCKCEVPQFLSCQHCAGVTNIVIPGLGLQMCCCYGCRRVDCGQVCLAGFTQSATCLCVVGCMSGCLTGCRMLNRNN